MEKFEKFMVPIVFVLLIFLGWVFLSNSKPKTVPVESSTERFVESPEETSPVLGVSFDMKSGEMGAVVVEVSPLSLTEYKIAFNTHSVSLDFDFTEIIKLKDDLGNTYDALKWSGGQGGHHLRGNIVFPELEAGVKNVTIVIQDIEDEILNLEWAIE